MHSVSFLQFAENYEAARNDIGNRDGSEIPIDASFRIRGNMKVFPNTLTAATCCIPLVETMALFMRYSGITGPLAAATFVKSLQDSIYRKGTGQGEILSHVAMIKDHIAVVQNEIIAKLPMIPKMGQVRPDFTVEVL